SRTRRAGARAALRYVALTCRGPADRGRWLEVVLTVAGGVARVGVVADARALVAAGVADVRRWIVDTLPRVRIAAVGGTHVVVVAFLASAEIGVGERASDDFAG